MEMVLPKQVQAELDAAAAIEAAMAAEQNPEGTPPEGTPEPPPPQAEAPPEAPPAEPVQQTAPEQVEAPVVQDDGFKAKYSVLQGKYNAEVPRLHQQVRELQQRLDQAIGHIQTLQTQSPEPQQAQQTLVTARDEEDFGAGPVDLARRAARDEITRANSELEARILAKISPHLSRVEQVEQRQVLSEDQQFWADVRSVVPDWRQVDTNPEWIAFLDSTPEYAEDSYRDMAAKAIANRNPQKIAALVKTFRGEPAPQPAPAPISSPNQELRRQVAPSSTRSSAPPQGEKMWSREEYEDAYNVQKIRKMAPDAAQALQAEADRAVAENRVRW